MNKTFIYCDECEQEIKIFNWLPGKDVIEGEKKFILQTDSYKYNLIFQIYKQSEYGDYGPMTLCAECQINKLYLFMKKGLIYKHGKGWVAINE